jgi:hypothetical protein
MIGEYGTYAHISMQMEAGALYIRAEYPLRIAANTILQTIPSQDFVGELKLTCLNDLLISGFSLRLTTSAFKQLRWILVELLLN